MSALPPFPAAALVENVLVVPTVSSLLAGLKNFQPPPSRNSTHCGREREGARARERDQWRLSNMHTHTHCRNHLDVPLVRTLDWGLV